LFIKLMSAPGRSRRMSASPAEAARGAPSVGAAWGGSAQAGAAWAAAALALVLALSPGSARAAAASHVPGDLDAARLAAADSEPQNWFTGGRDQDGTYYSPLASIDAKNVKQLGFAWQYDLGDPMRGQEAT